MVRRVEVLCPMPHRPAPDGSERHAAAADGLVLCRWHRDRLARHIALMPALYDAVAHALVRAGRGGDLVTVTRDPGISLDQAAVDARDHIRHELVSYVRLCHEEGPWSTWPEDTVAAMSAWLVVRCDWLAARPWACEAAGMLAYTWGEAMRAAYPDGARRIPCGPCPEPGCDGQLVAVVRDTDDLLPSTVRCDAPAEEDQSRHEWPADQWPALGRRIAGQGYRDLARRISSGT